MALALSLPLSLPFRNRSMSAFLLCVPVWPPHRKQKYLYTCDSATRLLPNEIQKKPPPKGPAAPHALLLEGHKKRDFLENEKEFAAFFSRSVSRTSSGRRQPLRRLPALLVIIGRPALRTTRARIESSAWPRPEVAHQGDVVRDVRHTHPHKPTPRDDEHVTPKDRWRSTWVFSVSVSVSFFLPSSPGVHNTKRIVRELPASVGVQSTAWVGGWCGAPCVCSTPHRT